MNPVDGIAALRAELEQVHQDHLRIEEDYLAELHEAKLTLVWVTAERDAMRAVVEATRRCGMDEWFSGGCPCEGHAALTRLDAAQQENAHAQ